MTRTPPKRPYPTAQMTPLEPRRMLSAGDPEPLAVELDAGTLRVSGTSEAEQILVRRSGRTWTVSDGAGWSTTRTSGAVRAVVVKAGAGNDFVRLDPSVYVPAKLLGNSGDDTLIGGSGPDSLYGHNGNDLLHGAAGDDVLVAIGGGLRDTLQGGGGVDSYWLDSGSSERIVDFSADENRVGGVHRVGAFESLRGRAVSKDITGVRPDLPDPLAGHAGGRWRNFASRPLFPAFGPGMDDVRQGELGDCYLHAPLAGVAARNPRRVREAIADLGDGTYAVQFRRNGRNVFYRLDADLPVTGDARLPVYAGLGREGALWAAIVEKAFAFFRTGAGTYGSIDNGGWFDEALVPLGVTDATDRWLAEFDSPRAVIDRIAAELADGRVVTVGTNDDLDAARSPLVGGHAYTVVRVVAAADGDRRVLVRNPWGTDGGAARDGSDDGYLTLTAEQLAAAAFAYTTARA